MLNEPEEFKAYTQFPKYNANGKRSFTAKHIPFKEAVSKKTADRVTKVLEEVVASGTGVNAQIDGTTVAGKTGTAEIGKGEMRRKNTWVIAFAPFEKPTVAIAMVYRLCTRRQPRSCRGNRLGRGRRRRR